MAFVKFVFGCHMTLTVIQRPYYVKLAFILKIKEPNTLCLLCMVYKQYNATSSKRVMCDCEVNRLTPRDTIDI